MTPQDSKFNKGFTLIELIIATTVFIAVMTISMGAIYSVFNSNAKSKNIKTALSNLNLALESMSREIRFGSVYHCGSSGTLTQPQDCPSGNSYFTFLSSTGSQITYNRNTTNQSIEKIVGSASPVRVTGSEIVIQSLTFYTLGSSQADTSQPKTVIVVRGTVGTAGKAVTSFALQTLVSQRVIDR